MFNACVKYSVNFDKIARLCKVEFSEAVRYNIYAIIAEALACLLANTRGVSVETKLRVRKQHIRDSYKRFSSKHTPSSMLEKLLVVFSLFLASLIIIYSI